MKLENKNVELLASGARIASINTNDQINKDFSGIHIIIDVTSITDTPSVVPVIEAKDPISGKYYALLTGAAITATGTTILKVFPGATAAANLAANDILPLVYRVKMTHGDADSITYSISANLI